MGIFYVNHVVRAPHDRVIAFLKQEGRVAYVSPTIRGYTIVCDRQCDDQDPTAIARLGQRLSAHLLGPVLAILNHDDALLCYWLLEHGQLIDERDSFPGDCEDDNEGFGDYWFCDDADRWKMACEPEDSLATVSDGEILCRVFGRLGSWEQVRTILDGRDALSATEIHQRLVDALGLPALAVGAGYRQVALEQTALDRQTWTHVGRPSRQARPALGAGEA